MSENTNTGIGSETPQPDVIEGWNIRNRDYNSVANSGLVPFVQLIGLYDDEEINKLIGKDIADSPFDIRVSFTEDEGPDATGTESWDAAGAAAINEEQIRVFSEKIESKYIQLNIKTYTKREDDTYVPGVILATNDSQIGNKAFETYDNGLPKDSGGIGISDLQIETGTKDFMNRRYKLRMTVTDPFILNDSPEYLKLSTLQSQFLLIHGWSNPHQIESMDKFDPPPVVTDIDQPGFPNGRMSIDLTNQNTGGMWSAATVAITMFDFAFNEAGQLEGTFTFMPREVSFAATYRIDLVAPTTQLFLGTGEEQRTALEQEDDSSSYDFAGLVAGFGSVAGEFGKNLADIIDEEQQAYMNNNKSIAGLFTNMNLNFDAADTLRNFSENVAEWSNQTGNVELGALFHEQKNTEARLNFPYAGPGIRVFTETSRIKENALGEEYTEINRNSKIQYYYLGWLMEAIRFSTWDMNKNRVKNSQTPFDLKFKYYKIPQDSHFNLAFQDQLQEGTKATVKELVPEMIANFKKIATPKWRVWDSLGMEMFRWNAESDNITGPMAKNGYSDDEIMSNVRSTALSVTDITETYASDFGRSTMFTYPRATSEQRGPAPAYQIMEGDTYDEDFREWSTLSREEKFNLIKERSNDNAMVWKQGDEDNDYRSHLSLEQPLQADYRKCLLAVGPEDPAYDPSNILVRIMHPDFDGQLLYNWTYGDLTVKANERTGQGAPDRGLYTLTAPDDTVLIPGPSGTGSPVKQWVYSKLNNFFVGESFLKDSDGEYADISHSNGVTHSQVQGYNSETQTNNGPLGIIMPAVSARYYTPFLYRDLQQQWYNKHIRFIYSHFDRVIRSEMATAGDTIFAKEKSVIYNQPVDLEWLTGRKYNHQFKMTSKYNPNNHNDVSIGQAATIPQVQGDSGLELMNYQLNNAPYSPTDPGYNPNRIILGGNPGALIEQQNALLTAETDRREERRKKLSGMGVTIDRDYGWAQGLARLTSMENNETRYTHHQIYDQALYLGTLIKEKAGLLGAVTFWENQLNKIIVNFYNKDLIAINDSTEDEDARQQQSGGNFTIAGANMLPMNMGAEFGWAEALNKWKGLNLQSYWEDSAEYQNRAVRGTLAQYPDQFPYIVEEERRRAAGKAVVPAGPAEENPDEWKRTVNELWNYSPGYDENKRVLISNTNSKTFSNITDYTFKFFKGTVIDFPDQSEMSFSDWKVNTANYPANLVAPTFGRYIFVSYGRTSDYNILDMEDISKLGELDLDSDAGLNYLYMNFLSDGDRSRYLSGVALAAAVSENSQPAFYALRNAKNRYNDFVDKQRVLAKSYLSQFLSVQHEIDSLNNAQNFTETNISQIEQELNNSIVIAESLENRESISPFAESPEGFDSLYRWDRGGGRYMDLDGLVAQHWVTRFDNRTVYGAPAIYNYVPPPGGIRIADKRASAYGWIAADQRGDTSNKYLTGYNVGNLAQTQKLISFIEPAHLDSNNAPYSILDVDALNRQPTYGYKGETYYVRGHSALANNKFQPSALITPVEYSGSDVTLWAMPNDDMYRQGQSGMEKIYEALQYSGAMQIRFLVRAGFVNVTLIKEILSRHPVYGNMDFKIDGEEDSAAAYTIEGQWPLLNTYPLNWGFHDLSLGSFDFNPYLGPAHLVDRDLDFVARVGDIFPKPDGYMPGAVISGGFQIDTADGDWTYSQSINDYKYDHNNSLVLYSYADTAGLDDSAGFVRYKFDWLRRREEPTGLQPDDYLKLNNNFLQYFASMASGSGRNFLTSGLAFSSISRYSDFSTKDVLTVYPNQRALRTSAAGDPDVDSGATIVGIGENILGEGDHIPQLPVEIAKKFVKNVSPTFSQGTYMGGDRRGYHTFNSSGRPLTTTLQPYGQIGYGSNSADTEKRPSNDNEVIIRGADPRFNQVSPGYYADYTHTGVCVNDILSTLPNDFEKGFFNSVSFANEHFNGGSPLSKGLVKWIAEDFMNLFTIGRRVAFRDPSMGAARANVPANERLNCTYRDVTFGDLMPDEGHLQPDEVKISRADFSNKKITSVAEIPIKRQVVDNLLSKRNSNMSLLQFFQQILTPNAIGLAGNVQLGVRNVNGVIDIVPASISYKNQTTDFFKEQLDATIEREKNNEIKLNHLLFEYKKRNSLIENIDMSSKMDPAAFLTYQNSSDLLLGRDYNVLKLLSYEGVAEDFQEFLDGTAQSDNSGETYSGIITVGTDNRVRVNKTRFKELPSSVVDSMIAQNPERWAKITSMMQGENNFTTELLAFYMRSVTLTIHGTTNLQPFNLINVSGVMPDLEGIYIITNLTEKVTPTTFQTVIEGKLLRRKRISDGVYI